MFSFNKTLLQNLIEISVMTFEKNIVSRNDLWFFKKVSFALLVLDNHSDEYEYADAILANQTIEIDRKKDLHDRF